MELNKIESLIEKYDKGNTSLSEEAQLRSYFSKKSIPHHLVTYKQLFFYFKSVMSKTCRSNGLLF